jgi:hypothetical protein
MRDFSRAIQGHPAITSFDTSNGNSFHFESTDILCSALATLPNLEYVYLVEHLTMDGEEVPALGRPESMTELLWAPSLRSTEFYCFCFTTALCEATANALEEGAAIRTSLKFKGCSFPEGGSEKIASALKRNATLTTFEVWSSSINEAFLRCNGSITAVQFDATGASNL